MSSGSQAARFLALRLGRIYPLHIFMIFLLIAYQAARLYFHIGAARNVEPFTGRFDLTYLPWNFLLLQKFAGDLSWNDPSWSIGVEWWTYVAFAVLTIAAAGRRAGFATAFVLVAPWLVLRLFHASAGEGWDSTFDCMMNFGLGIVICEMRKMQLWRGTDRIGFGLASAIEATVALGSLWMIDHFGGKLSVLIAPTFALAIATFSLERGALSRALTVRPMVLLGELSFSIYMIHHFILDRMVDLLWFYGPSVGLPIQATAAGRKLVAGNALACDLFSLALLAVVVGLSVLSYRYVEKVARDWSRAMLQKRSEARAAELATAAAF